MAKKRRDLNAEAQRQTRKEILLARKQAQQTRRIRLAMAGVGSLLVIVLGFGAFYIYAYLPSRAVAAVSGEDITLREWQERVRYERAQLVLGLENQLEAFGGDVGIIQQIYGQLMLNLQDAENFGQGVLDQMVNEVVIEQLAEARGITVTEADVDQEIGELYNYYGGELPTPAPTATETVVPTPSLTPVPTAVITDVLPTNTPFPTPTAGPTGTSTPTATPVSRESFEEQLAEQFQEFDDFGVDEALYRSAIRARLLRDKLADALAIETELPDEAMQASVYYLSFGDEETANSAQTLIDDQGFLTVWNTLRTAPSELELTGSALELLWRTRESVTSTLGEAAAEEAFTLAVGEASGVLREEVSAEDIRYYIIQVSGREVRPLSETALEQDKDELLASVIDQQLAGNLETTNFWRNHVPTQPSLDPKFFVQPTATPPLVPEAFPTTEEGS